MIIIIDVKDLMSCNWFVSNNPLDNENSSLYFVFFHAPSNDALQHEHRSGFWQMPERSAIFVAPIKEHSRIQWIYVHQTGDMESQHGLLRVDRYKLRYRWAWSCYRPRLEQWINHWWPWRFKRAFQSSISSESKLVIQQLQHSSAGRVCQPHGFDFTEFVQRWLYRPDSNWYLKADKVG